MASRKYLALLTDFGNVDYYVAVIKGILYRLVPDLHIIDISHELPRFSPLGANFFIEQTTEYLPAKCYGLVVIDPGVGGQRQILLVKNGEQYWLGPDNGCMSVIIDDPHSEVFCLKKDIPIGNARLSTFDARDRMAPFMSHLLSGKPFESLICPVDKTSLCVLQYRTALSRQSSVTGKILHIDHFGNVITNVKYTQEASESRKWKLIFKGKIFDTWVDRYEEISSGAALIAGSHGYIELACRETAAAALYDMSIGDELSLKPIQKGE